MGDEWRVSECDQPWVTNDGQTETEYINIPVYTYMIYWLYELPRIPIYLEYFC